MKVLFVADIHIKLGQKNVPIEWAKKRYNEFIHQLTTAHYNVDAVILGGDIFDRVPTLEELAIYFEMVSQFVKPTYIYDGNHEAGKKNVTFLSHIKEATSTINHNVEIIDSTTEFDDFTILPYCDLHRKNSVESCDYGKILFTHVRGEIPPHVKPEIDLDRFDPFPVVFAGDLHSHSNTQRNIVYPGSPMTTSFHRKEVETGYIIIDTEDKSWAWHKFSLPQLIRKTVTDPSEMVPTDYHHTIYELEGDVVELSNIKSTDLLDKKLVKRSTEATLLLDKDMTIQDELVEYLLYILEIPDYKVPELIGVFNDYSKRAEMG